MKPIWSELKKIIKTFRKIWSEFQKILKKNLLSGEFSQNYKKFGKNKKI